MKKIMNIFILFLIGLLIASVFWYWNHYGYRLEVMCNEVEGKTVVELERLIKDYDFDEGIIERSQDEGPPQLWRIGIRPHFIAACFIEHDQKGVISTVFLWA